MPAPTATIWGIEPHTVAKHEILRRYLGSWFPILASRNPRIAYIDGFCGPGRYKNGEAGSPIIALQEAQKHAARLKSTDVLFLFLDERLDRIEQLKSELLSLSLPANFHVYVERVTFDSKVSSLLVGHLARLLPFAVTLNGVTTQVTAPRATSEGSLCRDEMLH